MTDNDARKREMLRAADELEIALQAPGLTRAQRDDLGRAFWLRIIDNKEAALVMFEYWRRTDSRGDDSGGHAVTMNVRSPKRNPPGRLQGTAVDAR
jgi:hypothetical protein